MVLYLLHRLPDDNEDNAPFQIDPLGGVQGKQIHRYQSPLSDGRTNTLEYFLTQTEERVPVYRLILTFKNIYILKLATD